MIRKYKLGVILVLLGSMLILSISVYKANAIDNIRIKTDGSVDPATAPIQQEGDVYTLTDNIKVSDTADYGIIVEKDNVTIDGGGYMLQGTGKSGSKGILLFGRENVTIRNIEVRGFYAGIDLSGSQSVGSRHNYVSGDYVTNNTFGIYLLYSSSNIIYNNSFIDNDHHVFESGQLANTWDNGYPSGGNYWSNYNGTDLYSGPYQNETGSDDIGDSWYIDSGRIDMYPLMVPPTGRAHLIISIISPQDKAYATKDIPLTFTVSEPPLWISYGLDVQTNITISGNITLTNLSDGNHTVKISIKDSTGRLGYSDSVAFVVDTIPPSIEILSPENRTYTDASIPLSFTINESTSWIGYSLDDGANQTVFANNRILSGLFEGSHNLTLYAKDTAGNIGVSEKICFTTRTQQEPTSTWITIIVLITATVIGIVLLVYFTKFRKKNGHRLRQSYKIIGTVLEKSTMFW